MKLLLALAVCVCSLGAGAAPEGGGPKLDKVKAEAYIRYVEGFTKNVKLKLEDPVPSTERGFYRVIVHLTFNDKYVGDKIYYTRDGNQLVSGSVWDFGANPFSDLLQQLPVNGPSFGPADAPVTMVVFSDFQCPYCRAFANTIRTNLAQKYPKDVRVVFEDYPIDSLHPWARAAAEAGQCIATEQTGAFWAYHDWMFEHQQEVTKDNVRVKALDIAKQQNLNAEKVGSCIDTHATAARVNAMYAAAQQLSVQQTPTIFVNGRMLSGALPWNSLDALIQLELGRPRDIPGPSAAQQP